jgi:aminoglycoside phosphotransferase (APT) family kinase protein
MTSLQRSHTQIKETLMPARKTHVAEVFTDVSLVGRLLAVQFPQWANQPIEPFHSAGTDNAIYRLGDDVTVRLPGIHGATGQGDKEHRWLPRLAPLLPLAIPVPLARGTPAEGYPWHWSVNRWIEGETATIERIADARQAVTELAQFIAALHLIDPAGWPPPRGAQLRPRRAADNARLVHPAP